MNLRMKHKAANHGPHAVKPARPESDFVEDEEDESGEANHSLSDGHRNAPAASFEDGPLDSDDPNGSAWCAEAGAEDRLDELGF